jgi:hypothetical protein
LSGIGNVISSISSAAYELAYQVSPIILQGGIFPTGLQVPIIQLYGQQNLLLSAINAITDTPTASSFFATYLPLPGSTFIANQVGMYPFANRQVAANAIIQQPLTISLLMIAPVNTPGGYLIKQATFTALQGTLAAHNAAGGTYTVNTPAFPYTNLLMTGMSDVTSGQGNQKQIEYQLDFIQPLITVAQAAQAQSSLMAALTTGAQVTNANWSGPQN